MDKKAPVLEPTSEIFLALENARAELPITADPLPTDIAIMKAEMEGYAARDINFPLGLVLSHVG